MSISKNTVSILGLFVLVFVCLCVCVCVCVCVYSLISLFLCLSFML